MEGKQAAPVAVLVPLGFTTSAWEYWKAASWFMWSTIATCTEAQGSPGTGQPQAGSLQIEYHCIQQHALLTHCLEIFSYSTKEIGTVGSFYLSAG